MILLKNSHQTRNRRELLNLKKGIYKNLQLTSFLKVKARMLSILQSRTRHTCTLSPLQFNIILEVPARCNKTEEKRRKKTQRYKRHLDCQEKRHILVFHRLPDHSYKKTDSVRDLG